MSELVFKHDFREYLQDELLTRCNKNPKYSLRAFARTLGIGSSDLSKILNKKRNLSGAMLYRLGDKLKLDPSTIEKYKNSLNSRSKNKNGKGSSDKQFRQLLSDSFQVISDWYPLAILELAKCTGFKAEPKWIAKRLGVTSNEIKIAIERLRRLDLLEITKEGKWIDKSGATTSIYNSHTDSARRKHQKQILERAILAIDSVPIEKRDQSAMLMACDSKKISSAKNRIKHFRRSLCKHLEAGNSKDEVYYLTVSLFPVST